MVKNTYVTGFDDDLWDTAVSVVLAHDAAAKVPGFADWWKRNSWYTDNGKASLKTFIDEFGNYLGGVEKVKVKASNSEELTPVQQYARNLGGK